MPFAVESEDDLFDFIVYENPQQPDKETMVQLSIRHRIVPTRKCQIHESIVNLAVNLLLREIKLCSFNNLINQKFSDSALLLAIAVSSVALKSCQLWIHKVLFTYLRPFQKSFHCTCWLRGTIFD